MAIAKVWVEEDCIACGVCEDLCPQVFFVEDMSNVKEGVDFSQYVDQIHEAAASCPVEVIKFSEE
ncbi:MAG: ferredoxin [Paludibacter sp.]|jgi:ferredoxin|nr:ferredoxin [Paludibacteraceae bacterium]MBP6663179.1 ferredoxin [Paludibacter sp.]NCB67927.1 ferredoxin [Bacteroidia bacterium]MBP8783586.1 ferredoxin [Paludibacter sp.]MDD2994785.1 ferredoxin [Paludibacter sp.]